ncbi:MAG: heme exporter protein CcmB [Cardiobacteriaceae bacterium]|nr:heme exporter protein CcmB [Cardiobacteriaceae bacterium]
MLNLLIRREIRNNLRNPQSILQPVLFFILTICLFPLAIGADNDALTHIASAALWIVLLLAALLASEQLFNEDYADGTLSQDYIHLDEFWQLLLAKLITAWLRFALPLLAALPILALMLHIPINHWFSIAGLLALGSLPLLLIGMLGAVLTLAQNHSTFLRFLIVVPLYIPILIIGVIATHDTLLSLSIKGHYALLGAFTLFSLITVLPFSTLALKVQNLP